jgi:hypothetical protein|tara:strand:- start:194 stop:646 length:453 start_codon:yes stop_codon:yes gene_type:complete
MKYNINIQNISFSPDFNEITGLESYWVSGTLIFKDEEYEIVGSIDQWENINDLHLLHETPFTEEELESNIKRGKNIFDSEFKQWLFNVQLDNKLSSNILKLFEGEFYNPDYGHTIKKNLNDTSSKESLLKFIIIELFISNLNEEELKLKW